MHWYDKKWVIILFLFFFFPIGLFMMWRAPTFSTKTKGLVTVFFVLIFFAAGSNKTSTKTTTQNPPAQQATQKPADEAKIKETIQATTQAPPPAPAKVLNLGMTVDQFKVAFASAASSYGVPDLNINGVRYLQGSVQDSLRYDFSPNVSFVGIVNKSTGMIRSVDVMFTPRTNDDVLNAFLVYGIFMTIFNPELTPDERNALFDELCLVEDKILDLKDVSPKAIRGNRRYSVFFIEEYGLFSLVVESKDDN